MNSVSFLFLSDTHYMFLSETAYVIHVSDRNMILNKEKYPVSERNIKHVSDKNRKETEFIFLKYFLKDHFTCFSENYRSESREHFSVIHVS